MARRDMSGRDGVDIRPNRDVIQEGTEKLSNCRSIAPRPRPRPRLNCGYEQPLGMWAWLSLPSANIEANKNSTALIRPILSYGILRFRQISFRLINFYYSSYRFHSVMSVIINSMLIRSPHNDCLRAGRPREQSSSSGKVKNFLVSISSRSSLGPTQLPIQWVPGALSSGVKRQGREADRSPPTSAEVKKTWIYTSTPPYAFIAKCLIN
jgi:hypothetical protein